MPQLSKKSLSRLSLAALALSWGCGPVDASDQFDGTTNSNSVSLGLAR